MELADYGVFTDFSDTIRSIYANDTSMASEAVTTHQLGYLHFILEHDGCSQQELADIRVASKATISEMLYSLENDGLIYRTRNPSDRRKLCIHLTEKGRIIAESIQAKYRMFCDHCMQEFSQEEAELLIRLLRRFVAGRPGSATEN